MDELFFCVGSSQGAIYVYSFSTGKLVAELGHRRSTKAVRCCVFSRDSRYVYTKRGKDRVEANVTYHNRQIVSGGEDGFVMRYDYIDDDTLAEWANWRKDE